MMKLDLIIYGLADRIMIYMSKVTPLLISTAIFTIIKLLAFRHDENDESDFEILSS